MKTVHYSSITQQQIQIHRSKSTLFWIIKPFKSVLFIREHEGAKKNLELVELAPEPLIANH
jgi:hypothetical protein